VEGDDSTDGVISLDSEELISFLGLISSLVEVLDEEPEVSVGLEVSGLVFVSDSGSASVLISAELV
jgi:hypothetical protein